MIAYPPVEPVPTGTAPDAAGPPGTTGAAGLDGAGTGMTGMVDPSSGTDETEAPGVGTPLGATVTVK